jgi:hypothetical protein
VVWPRARRLSYKNDVCISLQSASEINCCGEGVAAYEGVQPASRVHRTCVKPLNEFAKNRIVATAVVSQIDDQRLCILLGTKIEYSSAKRFKWLVGLVTHLVECHIDGALPFEVSNQ